MDSACYLTEGRTEGDEGGREGGRIEGRKEQREDQEGVQTNRGMRQGGAEMNPWFSGKKNHRPCLLPAWTFDNNFIVSLQ